MSENCLEKNVIDAFSFAFKSFVLCGGSYFDCFPGLPSSFATISSTFSDCSNNSFDCFLSLSALRSSFDSKRNRLLRAAVMVRRNRLLRLLLFTLRSVLHVFKSAAAVALVAFLYGCMGGKTLGLAPRLRDSRERFGSLRKAERVQSPSGGEHSVTGHRFQERYCAKTRQLSKSGLLVNGHLNRRLTEGKSHKGE